MRKLDSSKHKLVVVEENQDLYRGAHAIHVSGGMWAVLAAGPSVATDAIAAKMMSLCVSSCIFVSS
jgi:hypothetical protein